MAKVRTLVAMQSRKIFDERVRAKVLDMYDSMGPFGIRLVQRSCGAFEDGGFGHETLTLLNSALPDRILARLAMLSLSHYSTLEGTKEEHDSWARRARWLGKKGVNWTLGQGGPKAHEQVSVPKQHGGRPGPSAATEGQRTSSSSVDEGQAN